MNGEKVVAAAAASLVAYTLALSVLNLAISGDIGSSGAVRTIGVTAYSDAGCASRLSSIEWGVLEPGESKNATCYVRNEDDSAVTLSFSTESWNPSNASEFLVLSWDYEGQLVDPGEVVEVTFTLAVSASVSGITDFNFDIIIVGSD